MPQTLWSVLHLLIAALLLELSSGLQGLVIPIRAQLEGLPTWSIGLLGTAYYGGFALGCACIPGIVHRIGHIRAFSGFAGLAAAALLVQGLAPHILLWLVLRATFGFCFAGLSMAMESWLN